MSGATGARSRGGWPRLVRRRFKDRPGPRAPRTSESSRGTAYFMAAIYNQEGAHLDSRSVRDRRRTGRRAGCSERRAARAAPPGSARRRWKRSSQSRAICPRANVDWSNDWSNSGWSNSGRWKRSSQRRAICPRTNVRIKTFGIWSNPVRRPVEFWPLEARLAAPRDQPQPAVSAARGQHTRNSKFDRCRHNKTRSFIETSVFTLICDAASRRRVRRPSGRCSRLWRAEGRATCSDSRSARALRSWNRRWRSSDHRQILDTCRGRRGDHSVKFYVEQAVRFCVFKGPNHRQIVNGPNGSGAPSRNCQFPDERRVPSARPCKRVV